VSARLLLIACLAVLAGCGKLGPPSVPKGEVSTYPHAYPAPTSRGGAGPDELAAPVKPASDQPAKPASSPDQDAKPAQ